jgi:hypothetical protein
MQLYGHIHRHNSLFKEKLEGKIQGKRSRDKHRLNWTGIITRWIGATMAVNTPGQETECNEDPL